MSEPESSAVYYDAELRPHRSLPLNGFFWVMALLGGASFCIGVGFILRGAWPVTPFCGLDVALVYGAFRLSYRGARQHERLTLTRDSLTLERVDVYGARQEWRFQPFWARIVLEEADADRNRLYLASHGRRVPVGTFLAAGERRKVAATLRAALARWREPVAER